MPRRTRASLDLTGIDWVIIGGESGPGARPMRLEWAREIVGHCRVNACGCPDYRAGVHEPTCTAPAVFVKQLGAKPIYSSFLAGDADMPLILRDRKGGDISEWPADLRIREFPRTPPRKRRKEAMTDPATPEEWQEAADAAYFSLSLDAAHQYGLVERTAEDGTKLEGSGVDVARCEEILAQAVALGIEPTLSATEGLASDA